MSFSKSRLLLLFLIFVILVLCIFLAFILFDIFTPDVKAATRLRADGDPSRLDTFDQNKHLHSTITSKHMYEDNRNFQREDSWILQDDGTNSSSSNNRRRAAELQQQRRATLLFDSIFTQQQNVQQQQRRAVCDRLPPEAALASIEAWLAKPSTSKRDNERGRFLIKFAKSIHAREGGGGGGRTGQEQQYLLLIVPNRYFSSGLVLWLAEHFCRARIAWGSGVTTTFELFPLPAAQKGSTSKAQSAAALLPVAWAAAFWREMVVKKNPAAISRFNVLKFLHDNILLMERTTKLRATWGENTTGSMLGFVPDALDDAVLLGTAAAVDFATVTAHARNRTRFANEKGSSGRIVKPYRIEENRTFLGFGGESGMDELPRGCCGAFFTPRIRSGMGISAEAALLGLQQPPSSPWSSSPPVELLFSISSGAVASEHFVSSYSSSSSDAGNRNNKVERALDRELFHRVGPRENWVQLVQTDDSSSSGGGGGGGGGGSHRTLRSTLRRPFLGASNRSAFISYHASAAKRFGNSQLCPLHARVAIHIPLFWPTSCTTANSSSPGLCSRLDLFIEQLEGLSTLRFESDIYLHVYRERLPLLPVKYKRLILSRFTRGAVYFVDHPWRQHPYWLSWMSRPLMRDALGLYDLFIYTEDDVGITGETLDYFCQNHLRVQRLNDETILGTVRYEKDPDTGRMYPTDRNFFIAHHNTVAEGKTPSWRHFNRRIPQSDIYVVWSSGGKKKPEPFYLLAGLLYSPFWIATGSDIRAASKSPLWAMRRYRTPNLCENASVVYQNFSGDNDASSCNSQNQHHMSRESSAFFESPIRILRGGHYTTNLLIPINKTTGCAMEGSLVRHMSQHMRYTFRESSSLKIKERKEELRLCEDLQKLQPPPSSGVVVIGKK